MGKLVWPPLIVLVQARQSVRPHSDKWQHTRHPKCRPTGSSLSPRSRGPEGRSAEMRAPSALLAHRSFTDLVTTASRNCSSTDSKLPDTAFGCISSPGSADLVQASAPPTHARTHPAMASDGATLGFQDDAHVRPPAHEHEHGHAEATALHRTPEIRETESGNVEVRKDPQHTSKISNPAAAPSVEQILDPRGPRTAATAHDILAARRSVEDTDTRLE